MTKRESTENNDKRVQATQDRRRSNAATTHADRRTRKNRDRAAQKRNAINEQRETYN